MKKSQAGFTILELMIAISVFSVILLVGSMMLIQIGRMYYQGLNSSRTQEVARSIVDEISRQVQFSVDATSVAAPQIFDSVEHRAYCLGGARYTYIPNLRLVPGSGLDAANMTGPHALWKDTHSGVCAPLKITTDVINTPGEELLAENMRVSELCVKKAVILAPATPGTGAVCETLVAEPGEAVTVAVRIIYGESDLVQFNKNSQNIDFGVGCRAGLTGGQWCASSQLETQVFRRLN